MSSSHIPPLVVSLVGPHRSGKTWSATVLQEHWERQGRTVYIIDEDPRIDQDKFRDADVVIVCKRP